MSKVSTFVLCAAFVAVSGCASNVAIDYDPDYDFTTFRTYRWYEPELQRGDALAANPLARNRVVEAVDRALAEKGFRLVDGQESDFLVFVHAASRDRVQVHEGGGFYYWRGPFMFGSRPVYVDDYEEQTLFVDVIDPDTRELIWRGSQVRAVQNYNDPIKAQAVMDKIVWKILKDFPPMWD